MSIITIGYLPIWETLFHEVYPPQRLRALAAEAALQEARISVLDLSDCDPAEGTILTHSVSAQGQISGRLPLPDVVFFLGTPTIGSTMDWQEPLIDWIKASRPHVADVGIEKTELRSVFTNSPCEKYLLPDAEVPKDQTAARVRAFALEQGGVVIKRSSSARGVGLFFILREQDHWVARFKQTTLRGTLDEAVDAVVSRIAGRLRYRDFLMQRHVRSVASDGRPLDIRVHVHKRPGGSWDVVRSYVRLAECGMPMTNISQGGYQGPLAGAMEHRSHRRAEEIEAEAHAAAIEIARQQDRSASCPLSELGIDFLIDEDDRLWLIETNTLPGSQLHEHQRAVFHIEYVRWIAEQGLSSPRPGGEPQFR
ncbi:YheC/YheD family protein [Cohaesibacter haloalkalitolerans]|uniref:YheC/YheD family protein n=1 Tax=Cohaesibacter haloalkalitolerans TaxID=1162980 RepID=UPI0013C50617|nr:YheC/YheD family protein [Cohaesibacter haloalkalitolerans]